MVTWYYQITRNNQRSGTRWEAPKGRAAETNTLHTVSDNSVGSLEVMFTFGAGDVARGCVDTQLLMRSGADGELVKFPSIKNSRRSAFKRVNFHMFTRATAGTCCSRTSSQVLCCCSRSKPR